MNTVPSSHAVLGAHETTPSLGAVGEQPLPSDDVGDHVGDVSILYMCCVYVDCAYMHMRAWLHDPMLHYFVV